MGFFDLFKRGNRVDSGTREIRLEMCHSCPSLKQGKLCGECGCVVEWKTKLATEVCPLGKW